MSPLREVWSSFMWCGQGCKARKTHSVVCLQRPGVSREDRNSLAVMEKDLFISWNNANFRCVLFLRFKVYPDEAFMTRVLLLHTSGHLIEVHFIQTISLRSLDEVKIDTDESVDFIQ